MLDYLLQYLLFVAEVVTVVAAIGAVITMATLSAVRARRPDRLMVRDLGERHSALRETVEAKAMDARAFKQRQKDRRREAKRRVKSGEQRRRVFVLQFKGDLWASAVASLRDEVTAVLAVAGEGDEVLVRLESAGGLMHDYGLAAAQLARVRALRIPLTVCVDKVAASGGYMMACVADRIVAAPFAVLGSIGVLAQIPNFHRLLDAHGIDFEQAKGGEFKRTVTLFGKNTDADRLKLESDVRDLHALFKEFVAEYRPALDLERVATGEHWPARRALELGLCDALKTSDDQLLELGKDAQLLEVKLLRRRPMASRVAGGVNTCVGALVDALRFGGPAPRLPS